MKNNLKLFSFFVLIFACNRLFMAATSYQTALILHNIGLNIILLSVLFYLIFSLSDYKFPIVLFLTTPLIGLTIIYFNFALGFRESMIFLGIIIHFLSFLSILRIRCLVGYVDFKLAAIWTWYVIYEFCGAMIYSMTQIANLNKYTYDQLVNKWGVLLSKSGSQRIYENLPVIELFLILSFIFWVVIVVSTKVSKPKNIPHDEINNTDVFLLILKPKRFIDLFFIIFRNNFISFYANRNIYLYSKSDIKKIYTKDNIKEMYKEHMVINTNIKISDRKKYILNNKTTLFNWYVFNPIVGKLSKFL